MTRQETQKERQLAVKTMADSDYIRTVGEDGKSYRAPATDIQDRISTLNESLSMLGQQVGALGTELAELDRRVSALEGLIGG